MASSVTSRRLFALVDANINRAKEGLRVIEDISRFILGKKNLSASVKHLRHSVTSSALLVSPRYAELLNARDSEKDPGRKIKSRSESSRSSIKAVLAANFKRVQEALRVLEEITKLLNPKAGAAFKELRYKTYSLEKKVIL